MALRWTRFAALACVAPLAIAASTPQLSVEPSDGFVDRPFTAVVRGAPPGARVAIQARFQDEQPSPEVWTAVGEYRANAAGVVDTARSRSSGGSYSGLLAGGLACSALPVPRAEIPAFLAKLGQTPGRTTPLIGTRDRFVVTITATVNGKAVGRAMTITRRYVAPDVAVSEVAEGRVIGLYFQPARATGVPVVVLGGSGGGVPREQAGLLASRGHPALALAYFNYKELKSSLVDIPLETFDDGARWLSRRTGVERVVLVGTSRGSEAVQLTAGYFPDHVAGLIAFVPSPLVHGGFGPDVGPNRAAWTLAGKPVPFVRFGPSDSRYGDRATAGKSPPGYSGSPGFLAEWVKPTAYRDWATPLDRIDVPMLLLGGGSDAMWPSAFGAEKIRERMAALGKGKLVELHIYPGAGHGLSRVGIANAISGFSVHPVSKLWSQTGGVPEANCAAGYDAWSRALTFLARL